MTDAQWGAAGAAVGALGGLFGNIGAKKRQERQMKHNRELAKYSHDLNMQSWREQWETETSYNTPAAQMERLRRAGINPHLAYASGSGANTGTMGAPPQYTEQGSEIPGGNNLVDSIIGGFQGYMANQAAFQQLRKQKAEADLSEINTKRAAAIWKIDEDDYKFKKVKTYVNGEDTDHLPILNVRHDSVYGQRKAYEDLTLRLGKLSQELELKLKEGQIDMQNLDKDGKLLDNEGKHLDNVLKNIKNGIFDSPEMKRSMKKLSKGVGKIIEEIITLLGGKL